MEFFVKNKTLAMTVKIYFARFSLAKTFLHSYQGIWRNLSARILLESEIYLYVYYLIKFLFRKVMGGIGVINSFNKIVFINLFAYKNFLINQKNMK